MRRVATARLVEPIAHIDVERMSPVFCKYHLRGPWPVHPVMHHFAEPDHGHPHAHPWAFQSTVLSGGYVEEVYHPATGLVWTLERRPGDTFRIEAEHIHRIVDLPAGECWTLILPEPGDRTSRFWDFRDDGAYSRAWHEAEWTKERQS